MTIRLAVIGAGYFGKHYIRVIQEISGIQLTAVCDKSEEAIQRVSHFFHSTVATHTDIDSVIKHPDIDGIVVATPASSHARIVEDCLKEGKAVLVEKPLTHSYKEALRVQQIAKDMSSVCMVAHTFLYNDYIRWLQSSVKNGAFGQLEYAYIEWLNYGPIRTDVDCLWDLGVHGLSILDYVCAPGKLIRVSGKGKTILCGDLWDFVSVNLEFESGFLATVILSWFSPMKVRKITVVGRNSMACFDDVMLANNLLYFYPPLEGANTSGTTVADFMEMAAMRRVEVISLKAYEPLRRQVEHFVECIQGKSSPLSGINDGVRMVQWLSRISDTLS